MFDILLVLALVASIGLGVWRNLVYELMAMLGLAASFLLSLWLSPGMAPRMPADMTDNSAHALAFGLVFVLFALLTALLAFLSMRLVQAMKLRPYDRALGGTFGFLRGVVLLLTLTVIMHLVPYNYSEGWRASHGGNLLTDILRGFKPVLPQAFNSHLPG